MMDFVEDYPRSWAKREEVELDTMSEWVKLIRSLILSQLCKIWKNTTIKYICINKWKLIYYIYSE